MLAILRQRDFTMLWLAQLLSMTGDWLLMVGLPLHIYQLTGSSLATGAMFVASMAPRLLLGSVAGVFIDRWDRRHTLVVANLLLVVVMLPLLVVQSVEWLWLVYVVAFLEASLAQFVRPAQAALLPRLLASDQLAAGNSLNSLGQNVSRLVGPPLGGLIVGGFGLPGVVGLDAASFLAAALLIALMTVDGRPQPQADALEPLASRPWLVVWRQWREGLRLVRRVFALSVVFVFTLITGVGEGVMSALLVPFVTTVLGGDGQGVGLLLGAQAVGGIVGSVLLARHARRIAPAILLGLGAIGLGLIDLLIFNYHVILPGLMPGLILMTIVGFPVAALGIGLLTLLQLSAEDAYRGRVMGAFGATTALASLIGAGLGGALGDHLGIVTLLNIQGVGYCLAGVLVLAALGVRPGEATGTPVERRRWTGYRS